MQRRDSTGPTVLVLFGRRTHRHARTRRQARVRRRRLHPLGGAVACIRVPDAGSCMAADGRIVLARDPSAIIREDEQRGATMRMTDLRPGWSVLGNDGRRVGTVKDVRPELRPDVATWLCG